VIKSRRMRWPGNVAFMGEMRNKYQILGGKLKVRNHLEDLDTDGRITLKWILQK
jgi:hypothetical protein